MLEPDDGKLSRPVLRGVGSREAPRLPGGRKYNWREPMEENVQAIETLSAIIRARRSIRSFTNAVPPTEGMKEILQSAIFAPFGRATDLPPKDIRKIFVFSQGTENINIARELLLGQVRRVDRKVNIVLLLFPFLRKKMGLFSKRISAKKSGKDLRSQQIWHGRGTFLERRGEG